MKILIDIPKAFEVDYNTDRFAEFFQRCLADMNTCCGNYEQETAEMMEKAFEKSRLYDPDKVVKQLESESARWQDSGDAYNDEKEKGVAIGFRKAIKIVKGGEIDGN